jgi:hypothetical protein
MRLLVLLCWLIGVVVVICSEFDILPPTSKVADSLTIVKPLLSCVGSGHATLTLRHDWRSQFTQTVNDIGFQSVRFHAILDDDMSTYLNGGANMYNV